MDLWTQQKKYTKVLKEWETEPLQEMQCRFRSAGDCVNK